MFRKPVNSDLTSASKADTALDSRDIGVTVEIINNEKDVQYFDYSKGTGIIDFNLYPQNIDFQAEGDERL